MKTNRNLLVRTLTFALIFAGSLTTMSFAEGNIMESEVTNFTSSVGRPALTIQTPIKSSLDGKWWSTAGSEEQQGVINGFIDCYQGTLRRYNKSGAAIEEYQKALTQFYAEHSDQNSTTVTEVMFRLVKTLKSNVKHLPGGEVWTEPHGFFDDQWWRESTKKERIGFLQGYIACYERYVKKPRVRFSRTAEEYSELLTKYFEAPNVDHTDEKIAHVLHRLAAGKTGSHN